MTEKITPAIKGLITGLLMILTYVLIFYTQKPSDYQLQYFSYVIYAAGIIWTLLTYSRSPLCNGKFGNLFNHGFRCFIVITLLMVLYTGIFSSLHPEFKDEMAIAYKEQMTKEGNKTQPEIEQEITTFKKQYTLRLVSGSIFGYLIIGAGLTAAVSALLTQRNK